VLASDGRRALDRTGTSGPIETNSVACSPCHRDNGLACGLRLMRCFSRVCLWLVCTISPSAVLRFRLSIEVCANTPTTRGSQQSRFCIYTRLVANSLVAGSATNNAFAQMKRARNPTTFPPAPLALSADSPLIRPSPLRCVALQEGDSGSAAEESVTIKEPSKIPHRNPRGISGSHAPFDAGHQAIPKRSRILQQEIASGQIWPGPIIRVYTGPTMAWPD